MKHHLIDSIMKEHADVLARREAARLSFISADADAQALTRLISDQGALGVPGASLNYHQDWLKAAERAAKAMWATLMPVSAPHEIADAYVRWRTHLDQLRARAA